MWAVVAAVVFLVADEWALIPGAIALLKISQSVSSTMVSTRMEADQARREEGRVRESPEPRGEEPGRVIENRQISAGPPGPEEKRVLVSPGGNEGEVAVSRVGLGVYRIQDFFRYLAWADEDVLEEAGVGSIVHIDELEDGRFLVKRITPNPPMHTLQGVALPGGFPQSAPFRRLADTVMELGGNWELVFGGILSVWVPGEAAEARSFDLHAELDRALDEWRRAE